MTAAEIIQELQRLGGDAYRKILLNHGAKEPLFGVKIQELKRLQKELKVDYELSLDLYESGIYDAQYLAGLIADVGRMSKRDLRRWLAKSNSLTLCGNVVAPVAAGSKHGWELALEWIESEKEVVAVTGWSALACLVSVQDDADLDAARLKELVGRVESSIHGESNRTRYAMNNFVIAAGVFVKSLTKTALQAAKTIGTVTVDMGATACKVPNAAEYIQKVQQRGTIGKKRKSAMC